MMTRLRIMVVGALLMLASNQATVAFLPREPVRVAFAVTVNSVDSSSSSWCEASEELQTYSKREWSVAVASTRPHPDNEWEATDRQIRCNGDSTPSGESNSDGASLNPYLISEISTVARLIRQMEDEQVLSVKVSIALEKLSGFEGDGSPIYEHSELQRDFRFSESGEVFVPLLVADGAQTKALAIHEVFLRVTASVVAEAPFGTYGAVLVNSGWAGAEVLLDGGAVGTIPADGELILRNVPVGHRVLRVRDDSGHDAQRAVRVAANRTVPVDFEPRGKPTNQAPYRLESLGENAQGYEEFVRAIDGAVVVRVPAGEFLMGNKETERSPLEHKVYVSEFLMDKTGVTWGQFKRFAAATGIPLPPHEPYWGIHDDHPVAYVPWVEAKAYCEWAGGRLPTEAEREKGARGTDGRKFPWGNEEPDPSRGVFRRTWGHEATGAVGQRPAGASPYGLLDMGGNVWEWCADWYDGDYYSVSPDRDPKGPESGNAHVVRGGSWDSRPDVLSASCRSWGFLGYRDGDFGFRCAMNAPNEPPKPD
jgi:formylglycine-generating enzyme required for sulfatase activity